MAGSRMTIQTIERTESDRGCSGPPPPERNSRSRERRPSEPASPHPEDGDRLRDVGSPPSRRDAVGRDEEGAGGDGIARLAMVFAQLALGLLPGAVAVGIDDEGVSVGDPGPERAPQGPPEQLVQAGMEQAA